VVHRRLLIGSLPLLIVALGAPATTLAQGGCRYECWARAGNVVPPTQSPGFAYAESDFDGRGECDPAVSLYFDVWYDSLASPPTGAHVRRGAAGINGELAFPLFDGYFDSGSRVTVLLDPISCEQMFSGDLYLVVETAEFPEGAIRGQFLASCGWATESTTWGRVRSLYR
jgi:hypothetical protein